jgi:uroporphyrin-III C-methyltransferase / precorrin-2 dehydrogenase / sirohydrochlorin ferrochelatase
MANYRSRQSDMAANKAARIGPLAVLPVFFNLRGKQVLVIGGGEPAVWKAELLAQAGATVEVIAPDAGLEMLALTKQTGLHGSVKLLDREWSLMDLNHRALVVADARSDGEAKAIFCAAQSAGVPVNVIDKTEFCTFQFGSIVNRSPVVIGISTDGAAPILGQAVRARIEAVLPPALADWALFAKEIRATVLSRYKAGVERRSFWSRFAAMAFGPFNRETAWISSAGGTAAGIENKPTVLSVDPDDYRELTLKAVGILQSADVIVHEARVSPNILDLARREAIRVDLDGSGSVDDRIVQLRQLMDSGAYKGKTLVLVVANSSNRSTASSHVMNPVNAANSCILTTISNELVLSKSQSAETPVHF